VHGWAYLWLFLAGIGAGLTGSVAGLASVVSYPALLAVGLSPISANMSNTVALVFSTVGSVAGSRAELSGQRLRARRLAVSAATGGSVGAALLLLTPSEQFAKLVPWLIGGASIAVLLPRNPRDLPTAGDTPAWELSLAVFMIAIYGGYFGAAGGVLLLATLMIMTGESLPRSNAMKNLLLGFSNAIAAVAFAVFGSVRWLAVLPLALGFLIGGRTGPVVVRHAPTTYLRLLISLAGVGLAVHLGLDAYG
jgi:uncharacterized membrane protein YfcA